MTCSSSRKIKNFPEPVGKINENVNFAFDNFLCKLKQVLRSAKDTAVWSNKSSKVIGGHFWREINLQENDSRTLVVCILRKKCTSVDWKQPLPVQSSNFACTIYIYKT